MVEANLVKSISVSLEGVYSTRLRNLTYVAPIESSL